jgi:hypothetical protein
MTNTNKDIENKETKKNTENIAEATALTKEELEKVAGGGMGRPTIGGLSMAASARKR